MMELQLTPEQQQIVESAETVLAKASAMTQVRAHTQSKAHMDNALWSARADLGWCGVHLPESVGGLDLDWVSVCLLQEQMGRRLACVPFFDTAVLSATALKSLLPHPLAEHWLTQIATEKAVASMALSWQTGSARIHSTGWHLDGTWPSVGSAQMAQVIVLPAQTPTGETLLFALDTHSPGLQITSLETLDTTRCLAQVQANGVNVSENQCLARGQAAEALLTRIKYLAAIGLAAEQVGVAEACLDMALAYVLERQQFGRPIASFQAIKHRCAQMLVDVESARSAVYGAACLADTLDDAAGLLVSAAQARVTATEAAQFCARENLQLHGGVGFTWEYDPHFYLRRAQASSQRLGPVSEWLESVAALYDTAE
jgi:alkylation response protein AidB-like acyl-CoA dehydrogenase